MNESLSSPIRKTEKNPTIAKFLQLQHSYEDIGSAAFYTFL